MTARTVIVKPGHRLSVRNGTSSKYIQDSTITLAPTDSLLVNGQVVVPPPPTTFTVTSVPALLAALAVDANTDITLAPGRYHVSPASQQAPDSLWIGAKFAARTKPVTVRCDGVIFDGGGASYFGGLTFVEGAHDQTWLGPSFDNGDATQTGVIVFGGYAGEPAPHHITIRGLTMLPGLRGSTNGDHAIYFSHALGGPHDILIEDYIANCPDLSSALQFFHSDAANANAWNVTVRRMTVTGTDRAISIADPTVHDIVIEDATVDGAVLGVRYDLPGQRITLRRVVTRNSKTAGLYAPSGQAGLTLDACSFT